MKTLKVLSNSLNKFSDFFNSTGVPSFLITLLGDGKNNAITAPAAIILKNTINTLLSTLPESLLWTLKPKFMDPPRAKGAMFLNSAQYLIRKIILRN